jgi:16S rRNA (cytosine967-C5)-methyltransferase
VTPPASLPLARLLDHAADALQAVRGGQSLTAALARCPAAARPGTQAPNVDALLLIALALLWPEAGAPYTDHTLVDQAVAAAKLRARHSAGFVNAVLRRFLREREALVAAARRDPLARFNHPAWWVERLKADWPDRWQAILDADNQRAPMTLRVNARRGSAAAYVTRLAAAGLAAEAIGGQAVRLAEPCPVTQLPGFAEGDVSVQDAAAQLAAPLLLGAGLAPGARVLDACAAPGGKTAHLLELADPDLLALDSDPARLARIDETLVRLQLSAATRAADAGAPDTWWDGRPFDRILLDAPCSAAGIVRRHPDVRWLRRSTDIAALVAIQARLLDALWPLLAPGGRLLYCTCSVFKAEGCEQIDAFLQRQPGATLVTHPPSPGHLLPLPDNAEAPPGHAISAAADGFFYALIEKTT